MLQKELHELLSRGYSLDCILSALLGVHARSQAAEVANLDGVYCRGTSEAAQQSAMAASVYSKLSLIRPRRDLEMWPNDRLGNQKNKTEGKENLRFPTCRLTAHNATEKRFESAY